MAGSTALRWSWSTEAWRGTQIKTNTGAGMGLLALLLRTVHRAASLPPPLPIPCTFTPASPDFTEPFLGFPEDCCRAECSVFRQCKPEPLPPPTSGQGQRSDAGVAWGGAGDTAGKGRRGG